MALSVLPDGRRVRAGIGGWDARKLHERLMRGEAEIPEFGLTPGSVSLKPDRFSEVSDRVEKALAGEDSGIARDCLKSARRLPGRISAALLDILAHAGCDAAAWLTLRANVETTMLPGPDGGLSLVSGDAGPEDGSVYDTHVELAPKVWWVEAGRLDLGVRFAETLLAAAIGRPLSDVISHQALDLHPMTIVGYERMDGMDIVDTDFADRPIEKRSIAFADLTPDHLFPRRRIGQPLKRRARA